jgi:5S rRNA maturation endonuclease (ribonuclease M5)
MARPDAESKTLLGAAVTRYEAGLEMVFPYLHSRGIDMDAARAFRLGSVSEPDPGHEAGRGRLCIPYLTASGVVVVKFRCVAAHDCKTVGHAKYLAPNGQRARLFNVAAFGVDVDYLAVCEGELDALVLSYYCAIPAVGVPGAGNWRNHRHWPRMFSGVRRVLVFTDPDDAGAELAARICESLTHARQVELPADVNDTYVKKGAGYIRQMAGLT